jgi:hypothetical protein
VTSYDRIRPFRDERYFWSFLRRVNDNLLQAELEATTERPKPRTGYLAVVWLSEGAEDCA